MGKSSAPATPDYKGQAIATANAGKYDESTPYGNIGWTMKPGADPNNPQPGDYVRTTTASPEQEQLYGQQTANQYQAGLAGSQMLANLPTGSMDQQATQDALYRRSTQYYDQNYGDQENALRSRLQNQGLTEGSEAYDRELRNFNQTKGTAYADAADRALVGADAAMTNDASRQNSAVNRLVQILATSQGQFPTSANSSGGAGADLSKAAASTYNSQLGSVNADNAQNASTWGTIGTIAAAFLSDRRLKSNVVLIGKAANGLNVYEYDILGTRERGHMADEVQALYPSAIAHHTDGWLMVRYDMIGGRPWL